MSNPDHWIVTSTGETYNSWEPLPENVNIYDIAWPLANIVRYGGHLDQPYTVGQHSIQVSRIVSDSPETLDEVWMAQQGLFHDAHEAYIGDLVTPVFSHPKIVDIVEDLRTRNDRAIFTHFGIPMEIYQAVTDADRWLLLHEIRVLYTRRMLASSHIRIFLRKNEEFYCNPPKYLHVQGMGKITVWSSDRVYEVFLVRHNELEIKRDLLTEPKE